MLPRSLDSWAKQVRRATQSPQLFLAVSVSSIAACEDHGISVNGFKAVGCRDNVVKPRYFVSPPSLISRPTPRTTPNHLARTTPWDVGIDQTCNKSVDPVLKSGSECLIGLLAVLCNTPGHTVSSGRWVFGIETDIRE